MSDLNWKKLAGPLAAAGAPILGQLIGDALPIPFGATIGGQLGKMLASAFSADETPESVQRAIEATPPDERAQKLTALTEEAKFKWPAMAQMAEAAARADEARFAMQIALAQQVGQTARAEVISDDPVVRRARPINLYGFTFNCVLGALAFAAALLWAISKYDAQGAALVIGGLVALFGAYTAFLGVQAFPATGYVNARSDDKQVAAGFKPPPRGVAAAVAAFKGQAPAGQEGGGFTLFK